MNEHLAVERRDRVLVAALNNPDHLNAFTYGMIGGLISALEQARADDDIRAVVITGRGRAFCTGGDLRAMATGRGFLGGDPPAGHGEGPLAAKEQLWDFIQRVPLMIRELEKPVIAAVNGAAVGAGCDLALMCDLRLASEGASFGGGYVKVGLVPGDGGAYFLPRLIGLPRALEFLLTGDLIDAREAERIGLINRVVAGDVVKAAVELAARIAASPVQAVRMIKRLVYQSLEVDLRTALDLASSHMAVVMQAEDHREGVAALLEKRRPVFRGR